MSAQETEVFVRFQHNLAQFRQSMTSDLSSIEAELTGAASKFNTVEIGQGLVESFRARTAEIRTLIRSSFADLGREYQEAIRQGTSAGVALPGGTKLGSASGQLGRLAIGELEGAIKAFDTPQIRALIPNFAAESRAAVTTAVNEIEGYVTRLRGLAQTGASAARDQGVPVTLRDVYGTNPNLGAATQGVLDRHGLAGIPTDSAELQRALAAQVRAAQRDAESGDRLAQAQDAAAAKLGVPSLSQATLGVATGQFRRVTNNANAEFARTNDAGQQEYYRVVQRKFEDEFGGGSVPELQQVTEGHIIQQLKAQEGLTATTLKGQAAQERDNEATERLIAARSRYLDVLTRSLRQEPGVGPVGRGYNLDPSGISREIKTPYGTGLETVNPLTREYITAQTLIAQNELKRGNPLAEGILGANQAEPLSAQRLTTSFAGGVFGRGFNPGAQFNLNEALPNLISTAGVLARYGALSTAIYGITKALSDTKKEALDYVDSLTDISVALDTTRAKADSIVPSLETFSRLAGTNVGASLDTAARGIRAFGEVGVDPTSKLKGIGVETARVANQIAVITHKSLTDATGDVIAIASAYGLQANQLGQVADAIANAKNNLGGDPGQISQGLANFAQVAHGANIDLQGAANLISVIQAKTDQSGQAVATRLARIVDEMQGAGSQSILKGLGVDTGKDVLSQFSQLKHKLDTLGPDQAKAITSRLAGTANLREFTVALQESDRIIQATGSDFAKAGAGQAQFDRLNRDLTATLRHLTGDLSNIQVNLARSGLLDIFGGALKEAEALLRVVSDLSQGLVAITHIIPNFGGFPLRSMLIGLGEIAVGVKAFGAVSSTLGGAQARVGALTAALSNIVAAHQTPTATDGAVSAGVEKSAKSAATAVQLDTLNTSVEDSGKHFEGATEQLDAFHGAVKTSSEGIKEHAATTATDTEALRANADTEKLSGDAAKDSAAAREASTASLDAETAALKANSAEQEANTEASSIGTRLKKGLASPVAKVVGVLVALQLADSAYNVLKDYHDKSKEADSARDAAARNYSDAHTAVGLADVAKSLNAAAAKEASVSSGFFGSAFNLLGGNSHTQSTEDLRAAAKQADSFSKTLTAAQAQAGNRGEAGVFQDLSSADGIKTGLDALSASGTGAAATFRLLTVALDQAAHAAATGAATILPGQGPAFSVRGATAASSSAKAALADLFGETSKGSEWIPLFTGDGPRKGLDLSKEGDRRAFGAQVYDHRVSLSDTTKLEGQTKKAISSYLDSAGVSNGGELGADQLNDLVDNKIIPLWKKQLEPYISPKFRKAWEAHLHSRLVDALTGQGDLGSLITDQGTSTYIQQVLVAQASTKAQDSQYGNSEELAKVLNSPANLIGGAIGLVDVRSKVKAAEKASTPVERAQQKLADINKAMGEAISHGTKITDETAQAFLQAQAELDQALEQRAQSIARYKQSLISSDDTIGRDTANIAELEREAAYAAAHGDPNTARDLRAQANEARQQRGKDRASRAGAISQIGVDLNDPIAVSRAQVTTDTIALNAVTKYGKDGKLTQAWAEAYVRVQQDKHALTQTELEQAATIAKAKIEAGIFPDSAISTASAKIEEAKYDLSHAQNQAEWWQAYAALHQAQYEYANAVAAYHHEQRLGNIDITNPVQVAREDLRTAREKLRRDQANKEPDDVIQGDKNAITSANLSAQQSKFSQRLSDIQVAHDLGSVSDAAYLRYLDNQQDRLQNQIKGMKKTDAGYRQAVEQLQTIDQAIKAAGDSLSGQWNIGDIKVPTPYEMRRIIASKTAGIHYGDVVEKSVDTTAMSMGSVTNNHTTNHVQITVQGADSKKVQQLFDKYFGHNTLSRVGTTTQRVR